MGEDATDGDATAFCTTAASTRNKLLAATETTLPFVGEGVVAIVAATARCTLVATSTKFKPELNNLPTTEKRFLNRKNSSKQVEDGWCVQISPIFFRSASLIVDYDYCHVLAQKYTS
jgi:hypothetical protein